MATTARTVDELVDLIRASYPAVGGRDGFLSDPGGWVDFLDLLAPDLSYEEQDRIAAAAIGLIEGEQDLNASGTRA